MTGGEEIAVRLATPDDIDAIAWIYGESFGDSRPRRIVEQYLQTDRNWALLATMGDERAMTPAGFAIARTVADEAEILSVGVAPLYRRRGIGETLLEGARRIAAMGGAGAVFLEVGIDNTAARALYAKAGYTVAGRRPAYYRRANGSPVDALLLRLSLEPDSAPGPERL